MMFKTNHAVCKKSVSLLFVVALVASLVLPFAASFVSPASAYALDVQKCTARPNSDSSSDVLGGVETRITWEAQADADESLASISLTLPEGTTCSINNAKATLLTGDDLMTRVNLKATFAQDGQTVIASFGEPGQAGGYYRIELYGVMFPQNGGNQQLTGTYTLTDGTVKKIASIPTIAVKSTTFVQTLSDSLAQQEWVKAWNSNTFLRLFLNPPIFVSSLPIVLQGFFMAVGIVLVAFPIAIPLGLLLSFMRMSKFAILRGLGSLYVNVVRGTPVFLQVYIAFFGLPLAGINIPSFPLGVIVLAMNSAAYQCEIFRAGIQSISKGQFEAARSLGMNAAQTMAYVIIPQTVRRVLPTMTNEFILLYKDTSMLAAVGVMELVMYAKTIVASTGSITPYIVAALFYLVLTLPLAKVVGNLERRLAGNETGGKKKRDKKGGKRKDSGFVDARIEGKDESGSGLEVSPERFSSM